MTRDLSRLTRDQVAAINAALAAIFQVGAYGKVELVVEKDRISQIETTFSVKFKGTNGSGDALASTG